MAQHKAPTAVTIAPLEEKAGLAAFVHRTWKLGALLALLIAGWLIYRQYAKSAEAELQASNWTKFMAVTQPDSRTGLLDGKPSELLAVADQIKGSSAGPWALYAAATSAVRAGNMEDAKAAVARLRQEYPIHSLVTSKVATDPGTPALSMVESLEQKLETQASWRSAHPEFFANPALPADAPRVRINTDRGSYVVGLYASLAPHHVENFLRLAREGSYNGIRIHRVIANQLVQAGDPNTLKDDTATWGTGEVGNKLEPEVNSLRHFAGALAAARTPGSKQSSGSQFYVCVSDNHTFDGDYVVFGTIVEGMDVVRQLSESKVVEGTERPETPPTIQSTEVL